VSAAAVSPAAAIITRYTALGVRLWAESDRLEVAAPKGVLAPGDLDVLREHKPVLLAFLGGRTSPGGPAGDPATDTPPRPSAEVPSGPWSPRPLPWRAILPRWPTDAREKWGRRADQLEDEGVAWPESERRAFEELGGRVPTAGIPPDDSWQFIDEAACPAWADDERLSARSADLRAAAEDERGRVAGKGGTVVLAPVAPDSPAPAPTIDPCKTPGCGSVQVVVKEGIPPHYGRMECARCGRFRKWTGKAETPAWLVERVEKERAGRPGGASGAAPAAGADGPTLFD
jgi:hypothetical protein